MRWTVLGILLLCPLLFPARVDPPNPLISLASSRLVKLARDHGADLAQTERVYQDYRELYDLGYRKTASGVAAKRTRSKVQQVAFGMRLYVADVSRQIAVHELAGRVASLDLPPDEPEHRPLPTRVELAGVFNTLLETDRAPEAILMAFRYKLETRFNERGPLPMRVVVGRQAGRDGKIILNFATPNVRGKRIKISKSGLWIDRFALYTFRFSNGAEATGTADHEMLRFRQTGRLEKVPLRLMRLGDLARSSDGRVISLVSMKGSNPPEPVEVYNITVAGAHTYFVGGERGSVLVHNASPEDYARLEGRKFKEIAVNHKLDPISAGRVRAGVPMSLPAPQGGGFFSSARAGAAASTRKITGVATAGKALAQGGAKWLRGTSGNAARFPKEVADRMAGKVFHSMDGFRRAFWKEVARTPHLAGQFQGSKANTIDRMKRGLAPLAPKEQRVGKLKSYVLHHHQPLSRGGKPYDMENIRIVTPRYHQEVLSKSYHYGKE